MASHTDEPSPRADPELPRSFVWHARRTIRCPLIAPPTAMDFDVVVEQRRSVRTMGSATLRELVNFLAYATSPRFVSDNDPAQRSLRPSPSAGALHCIDTLIVDWRISKRVLRYDPGRHALEILHVIDRSFLDGFASQCASMFPTASRTAIVLTADLKRIGSRYENAESLVWRDAGVLLQTLSLCATAYRLATCIVGSTGAEIPRALELSSTDFAAVGAILVGRLSAPKV
jgi:SagB-type dehydrogenase family enzyme